MNRFLRLILPIAMAIVPTLLLGEPKIKKKKATSPVAHPVKSKKKIGKKKVKSVLIARVGIAPVYEWNKLINALHQVDIDGVRQLVPRVINPLDRTQPSKKKKKGGSGGNGKTPLQMAQFELDNAVSSHGDKHKVRGLNEIVVYLQNAEHLARSTVRGPAPVVMKKLKKKLIVTAARLEAATHVIVQKRRTKPAQVDWDNLIDAIKTGDEARVRGLVPGKIKPTDKTRVHQRTPLEIARYEYSKLTGSSNAAFAEKMGDIVFYLESLSGQEYPAAGARRPRAIIAFYERGNPYYEFTNFYELHPLMQLDGYGWKTTEHYFQANKFPRGSHEYNGVLNGASARAAFDYARDNERYKRSDWETAKYGIMLMALRAKFGHNPRLRKLLLDTGDAELIEDAGPKDACWGNGPNRRVGIGPADGRNYLGRMLMHVRDEIRTGQRKPFTVDHPCPAFDPRKTPRGPIIIP